MHSIGCFPGTTRPRWMRQYLKTYNCTEIQILYTLLLLASLFLADSWVLGNAPNSSDPILYGILTGCFVLFALETIFLSIFQEGYFLSFFFWMDLLGTVSILLDVGWVTHEIDGGGTNAHNPEERVNTPSSSVLRTTRAARLGSRYGRLLRMLRLMKEYCLPTKEEGVVEPSIAVIKRVSEELSRMLSLRTAALVILLAILVPLLSYTDTDTSPTAWIDNIKLQAKNQTTSLYDISTLAHQCKTYYGPKHASLRYISIESPYAAPYSSPFITTYTTNTPLRNDNTQEFSSEFEILNSTLSESGSANAQTYLDDSPYRTSDGVIFKVRLTMDYTDKHKARALYNILLIILVIAVLVIFTASYSSAVKVTVVQPLEKLMASLRKSAMMMIGALKEMEVNANAAPTEYRQEPARATKRRQRRERAESKASAKYQPLLERMSRAIASAPSPASARCSSPPTSFPASLLPSFASTKEPTFASAATASTSARSTPISAAPGCTTPTFLRPPPINTNAPSTPSSCPLTPHPVSSTPTSQDEEWVSSESDDDSIESEDLEAGMLELMVEKVSRIVRHIVPSSHMEKRASLDQNTSIWVSAQFPTVSHRRAFRVASVRDFKTLQIKESTLVSTEALNSWDFDVLKYQSEEVQEILTVIFGGLNLLTEFSISTDTFRNFTAAIASLYLPNTYHNFHHGADVCHLTFRILTLSHLTHILSTLEVLALLLAALAHDVGHLGVNNGFLVKSMHELALRYNDRSPLENLHCSILYDVLGREGCNVLKALTTAEAREARKLILSVILATDMAHHFDYINRTQLFLEVNGEDSMAFSTGEVPTMRCMAEDKNRTFIMELVLHCADVSNPFRPAQLSFKWADKVTEEFCAQGDRETELGYEVSPMCDRKTVALCNMQLGFIEFVVAPLVIAFVKLLPGLHEVGANMKGTFQAWGNRRLAELDKEAEEGKDVAEESIKLQERMTRFRDKLEFVCALSCMPQRQLTAAMDSSCAGSFSFKSHSSKSEVTDFGDFDKEYAGGKA